MTSVEEEGRTPEEAEVLKLMGAEAEVRAQEVHGASALRSRVTTRAFSSGS